MSGVPIFSPLGLAVWAPILDITEQDVTETILEKYNIDSRFSNEMSCLLHYAGLLSQKIVTIMADCRELGPAYEIGVVIYRGTCDTTLYMGVPGRLIVPPDPGDSVLTPG
jgi:hypothetical protein